MPNGDHAVGTMMLANRDCTIASLAHRNTD